MALVERWNTTWVPIGQAVTYDLRILEEGYGGGATSIVNLNPEPLDVRNRGNEIFSIGSVIGTEIEFKFEVTTDDGTDFDDLLAATERQFLIEVDRDSVPYFVGFMNPENVSRSLYDRGFSLKLTAADGLAYLKQVPYRTSSDDNYTDKVSLLTTIKRALTYTGHELDINIKLGVHHLTDALMTAIENALDKTTASSGRFYRANDGVLTPDNCAEVLTQCLGIFNCSIKQLNGEWYIYNNSEVNSYLFTFDWATLTQQRRVSHNPLVTIDAYEFTKGQVAYRHPLSKLAITFENKFLPTNLVTNGDFSSGITGWVNGTVPNNWDGFAVASEILECSETGTLNDDKEFVSPAFNVNQISPDDVLKLSVDIIADTSFPWPPFVHAELVNSTTAQSTNINLSFLNNTWTTHIGEAAIIGTGSYTIRIVVEADSVIPNLDIRVDNVTLYVDYGDSAVTVDKIITIKNDNAVDERIEEYTTKIGDSLYSNDEGKLEIGGTLTTEWRTYNATEDEPIIDLLGVFQLNARQAFTKYLTLNIVDLSDNINPGTIIGLDSKEYRIIRFNKRYRSMIVDVDVHEINS